MCSLRVQLQLQMFTRCSWPQVLLGQIPRCSQRKLEDLATLRDALVRRYRPAFVPCQLLGLIRHWGSFCCSPGRIA